MVVSTILGTADEPNLGDEDPLSAQSQAEAVCGRSPESHGDMCLRSRHASLQVLTSEQDLSTKRNAFLMLCQHDQNRAIQYLLTQLDSVAMWGDILQMAVLELIRKVWQTRVISGVAFLHLSRIQHETEDNKVADSPMCSTRRPEHCIQDSAAGILRRNYKLLFIHQALWPAKPRSVVRVS